MKKEKIVHTLETYLKSIDLEVSKIVKIKAGGRAFIYYDQLDDGTWRMTYTEGVFNGNN